MHSVQHCTVCNVPHRRPVDEAEQLGVAEGLARRLDRPLGVLGVLFLLRAYVAGFSARFWKRNRWQVLFLLLPFLRFVRGLEVVLALYSVAVLATLAGSAGAYFLRDGTAAEAPHYAGPDTDE